MARSLVVKGLKLNILKEEDFVCSLKITTTIGTAQIIVIGNQEHPYYLV